jgi:hypothetical protein
MGVGAVSSEWCFPEGFSVLGIAHWNKFHASVLMSRRLMAGVGGYDPGIPWGLEDWNYWLSTVPHNPIVRFVPETTFYYRYVSILQLHVTRRALGKLFVALAWALPVPVSGRPV